MATLNVSIEHITMPKAENILQIIAKKHTSYFYVVKVQQVYFDIKKCFN